MKYQTVIDPNSLNNSHSQILAKISANSKVLDVGCGSGFLGAYLHNEKNCTVDGLELDEDALSAAKKRGGYRNLIQCNLAHFDVSGTSIQNEKYDYIVFGDVLEHLTNPSELVGQLKAFLVEMGCFVVSLPNVAHGSVKLNLLGNRFEYTREGLLDQTHVHFFTLSSILVFFKENGLRIESLNRIFVSIYKTEQKVKSASFTSGIRRFVEKDVESWVYQYVLVARISSREDEPDVSTNMSDEESQRLNKLRRSLIKKRFKHALLFRGPIS